MSLREESEDSTDAHIMLWLVENWFFVIMSSLYSHVVSEEEEIGSLRSIESTVTCEHM